MQHVCLFLSGFCHPPEAGGLELGRSVSRHTPVRAHLLPVELRALLCDGCPDPDFSLEETEQLHGFRSCQMFDV